MILACAGYLTSRDRIGNPWKLQRLKLSDLKLQGPEWEVAESIRARNSLPQLLHQKWCESYLTHVAMYSLLMQRDRIKLF